MNLKFEILNGEIINSGQPLFTSSNRALRYGDGLFETIKVHMNEPHFLNDHIERLRYGMETLHLNWPSSKMEAEIRSSIEEFIRVNSQPDFKMRLIVFRESTGFYTPASDSVSWHLYGEIIDASGYGGHSQGLTSGLFSNVVKTTGRISNVKSLNCLVSVLAGVAARDRGWDEAVIMNNERNIIESASSNLFIRKGNSFTTPPLFDGCLDGVMRKNVMKLLVQNGVNVVEKSLSENDLLEADEILLTNSIAGVRWIENYEGKKFQNTYAAKINDWLNEIQNKD